MRLSSSRPMTMAPQNEGATAQLICCGGLSVNIILAFLFMFCRVNIAA